MTALGSILRELWEWCGSGDRPGQGSRGGSDASRALEEASMADDLRGVIDEMKLLRIAIGSVNPDPRETIQAYRDRLAAQQRAADHLVTATEALVRAIARGLATWVLVV